MYYKAASARIVRWLVWCLVLGIISISLCGASQNNGVLPVNKNLWLVVRVSEFFIGLWFSTRVSHVIPV